MNTHEETGTKVPRLTAQQRVSLDSEITAIDRAYGRSGMAFHQRMKLAGRKTRELEARFAQMTGVAMTRMQIENVLKDWRGAE